AADQHVIPVAAGDPVVAGPAVDRQAGERGEAIPGHDRIIAAAGVDHHVLDAADVQALAADIEAHARAVRRDEDGLAGVGAVDLERIDAALALDLLMAVAGVENEPVVAVAQEGDVAAGTARDDVVA